ncbi:MAG: hypothetical protein QOC85_3022, partial [Streptomyces sp.]|nr:hypothetical protein [Streptomyces sp.]
RVFVTGEPGIPGIPGESADPAEPVEPAESGGPGAPVGAVAGLVVVEACEDHLFLDSIAVHPDAHGKGVGSRLLAFVEAHARALGLREVRLYTNAMMWENQKIYPKYGYEVVERRVEGPYDRIHYRKRLR